MKLFLCIFNGMKFDNSILLKSICDDFYNVTLNVIGNSCESFKMIDFKFKKLKYSLKLLDVCNCNFIKGSLSDLSKNLNKDKDKIITKEHFSNNYELLKYKTYFPYECLTKKISILKIYHQLKNFIVL